VEIAGGGIGPGEGDAAPGVEAAAAAAITILDKLAALATGFGGRATEEGAAILPGRERVIAAAEEGRVAGRVIAGAGEGRGLPATALGRAPVAFALFAVSHEGSA